MKIAICDDDVNQTNLLEGFIIDILKEQKNKYIDVDVFSSGEELLKQLNHELFPFNIIFMDLELKGINGINTAKEIRKVDDKVIIIFVTSHSKYVYDSFEVSPFRFLVKPVSFDDFARVFDLALIKFRTMNRPFSFLSKGKTISLYCDDILYFESIKREIYVHSKQGTFSFYSKLQNVYENIYEFDFIYPHQSYVVNMKYITVFSKDKIMLLNDIVIPVSRQKSQKVREEYLKYSSRSMLI